MEVARKPRSSDFGKRGQSDSNQQSAIIGRERASWAEITRLIWVYIKEHKLQNPDNGIFFKPDQQLATIIGTEGEYMDGFTMMKFVKKHILPN